MKTSIEYKQAYRALETLCEAYNNNDKNESELAKRAAQIVLDLGVTPEIRSLPQRGDGIIVLHETEQMMHTEGIYLTGEGAVRVSCGMNPYGDSPANVRQVSLHELEALFRNEKETAKTLKATLARKFQ